MSYMEAGHRYRDVGPSGSGVVTSPCYTGPHSHPSWSLIHYGVLLTIYWVSLFSALNHGSVSSPVCSPTSVSCYPASPTTSPAASTDSASSCKPSHGVLPSPHVSPSTGQCIPHPHIKPGITITHVRHHIMNTKRNMNQQVELMLPKHTIQYGICWMYRWTNLMLGL